jgi:hypothetical protein
LKARTIQLSCHGRKQVVHGERTSLTRTRASLYYGSDTEEESMKLFALLLAGAVLAGCNVETKDPSKSDDNVQISADANSEVSFDFPFASGRVKLPQSMMRNGNFDLDGVKLMPGSSLTGFSVFAGDKNPAVTMTFNAPASPDEVRAYFMEQFKQKGVQAALAGGSVTGTSKDGDPFTIEVQPGPGGSQGKIILHDKS